jgi:hypothetical protein
MDHMSLMKFRMGLIVSLCAMACTNSGGRTIHVGDHTFEVPKNYLVQGTIPWLPSSQERGLRFVLQPRAPLPDQMIVGLENAREVCRPELARSQSENVRRICMATKGNGSAEDNTARPLRKVYPNPNDPTQWSYFTTTAGGDPVEIAYCIPAAGEGLCTAMGNYYNLFYTVGFREREMSQVFSIRRKVVYLLARWERR